MKPTTTFLLCLLSLETTTIYGFMGEASASSALTLKYSNKTKQCSFNLTTTPEKLPENTYIGEFGEGCPGYIPPEPPIPPPPSCTPTPGLTRNLQFTTFAQVYGAFPGNAAIKTFSIQKNQYIALGFTVPNLITPQTIGKFSNLSTGTSASFSTTITECAGDFTTYPTKCGLSKSSEGNLPWVADYNGGTRCPLIHGKTYYFNILSGPLGTGQPSTCGASICSATIKNAPNQ